MISVVLIEPKTPANIGAIARAMKNFGFINLIIVNPRCNPLHEDAKKLAKHAGDLLKKAKIRKRIPGFDYKIATTAKLGSDYNLSRCPLTPRQLSEKISKLNPKSRIAILIGREDIGLTNEEINGCDFSVSIDAAPGYPTLSISHATAIILYEIFNHLAMARHSSHITPVSKKEKDELFRKFSDLLNKLHFSTKEKKQTQKTLWKRMLGKSFLTKREAFALFGFFKKIQDKLDK